MELPNPESCFFFRFLKFFLPLSLFHVEHFALYNVTFQIPCIASQIKGLCLYPKKMRRRSSRCVIGPGSTRKCSWYGCPCTNRAKVIHIRLLRHDPFMAVGGWPFRLPGPGMHVWESPFHSAAIVCTTIIPKCQTLFFSKSIDVRKLSGLEHAGKAGLLTGETLPSFRTLPAFSVPST